MELQKRRTKWGRTRFGGQIPALPVAAAGGILLAAAGGWLAAGSGVAGANPVLGFAVFTACLAMPALALTYALVVDRNSIEGAVERPGESVEGGWYDKAASGSFTDLILVLGAAATVIAFIPADLTMDLRLVLPGVVALCFVTFGIRYVLLRRRG
jgi:hypothetical protein